MKKIFEAVIRKYIFNKNINRKPIVGSIKDHIIRHLITSGHYEPWMMKCVDKLQKINVMKGGYFIDIGANIGIHSIGLSDKFMRVVAIEPAKIAFKILSINVELNNITNITCFNLGIGSSSRSAMFFTNNSSDIGCAGLLELRGGSSSKEIVSIVPFSDFILLNGIDISKVSFIKIDVEGAEEEVITSVLELVKESGYRPVICFEYLVGQSNLDNLIFLLKSCGYNKFSKVEERKGLFRFIYALFGMDLYTFQEMKMVGQFIDSPGIFCYE